MGKGGSSNPTIRILILGAPGVGKNCLESRFTTSTWPPSYDPTLTLSSRRFFTLSSARPECPPEPTAGCGMDVFGDENTIPFSPVSLGPRPETASSMFPHPEFDHHNSSSSPSASTPATSLVTSVRSQDTLGEDGIPKACEECVRRANTYLVEVINYPALQFAKARQHLYAKREYEAVLLVYDVGDRKSFDAIANLHGEIPLGERFKNPTSHRRAFSYSSTQSKSSNRVSFFGKTVSRRSSFADGKGATAGSESRSRETVVALIGNKVDVDAEREYACSDSDLDSLSESLVDKVAKLEEADVEERSLVHPLYRESRWYDGWSLTSLSSSIDNDRRRSGVSADRCILDPRQSRVSTRKATKSMARGRPLSTLLRRAESIDVVETWLKTRHHAFEGVEEEDETLDGDVWPSHPESNNRDSTASSKRQVLTVEGEMLARALLLQVPFMETSAKTGENIERAFSAIVDGVLKEMGKEPPSEIELLDRCCTKHGAKKGNIKEPPVSTPVSAADDPAGKTDEVAHDLGLATRGLADKAAVEECAVVDNAVEQDSQPRRQQIRRRESMMDKMRKMFKKQAVVLTA